MRHARLALLVLAASAAPAGAQESPLVIRAGTLLDGRGARSTNARITIREGRIEAVSADGPTPAASTYDLSAYTILPGLIDAHDHLAWHFNAAGKLHTASDGETPAQGALAMAANAWATLTAGITTAQSPGSPEDADLRAAIAQGLPGPRLLTSLEPLDQTSGNPDELRAKVRERKQAGADLIKLFASKSIREGGARTMTDAQLEAACGEAKALGLRTLVHAHSAESMAAAARAGCTQVEHGVFADEATLALLAARGTYFDPQCGLVFRNYLDNRAHYLGIGNYSEAGFAAMERDAGRGGRGEEGAGHPRPEGRVRHGRGGGRARPQRRGAGVPRGAGGPAADGRADVRDLARGAGAGPRERDRRRRAGPAGGPHRGGGRSQPGRHRLAAGGLRDARRARLSQRDEGP
jgi:hypothetical protein